MSFQQDMQYTFRQLCEGYLKLVSNYNLFRKKISYKNIEAKIYEILAIFKKKKPKAEILKRI